MDEPGFRLLVAAKIKDIARQIDTFDTDAFDWKLTEGVLSVEFEAGGVFVLSQQVPVRELWLSAFSRAWHFGWREDRWVERDSAVPMDVVLTELFTRKLGFEATVA